MTHCLQFIITNIVWQYIWWTIHMIEWLKMCRYVNFNFNSETLKLVLCSPRLVIEFRFWNKITEQMGENFEIYGVGLFINSWRWAYCTHCGAVNTFHTGTEVVYYIFGNNFITIDNAKRYFMESCSKDDNYPFFLNLSVKANPRFDEQIPEKNYRVWHELSAQRRKNYWDRDSSFQQVIWGLSVREALPTTA